MMYRRVGKKETRKNEICEGRTRDVKQGSKNTKKAGKKMPLRKKGQKQKLNE
jgi:hypothetical protein